MVAPDQDAFQVFNMMFTEPPKEPNTYTLSLDESNPDNQNVKLDDILIHIFFNGIKILYGEDLNLQTITQDQFDTINKYINSFGYNTIMTYEYDENNFPVNVKVWFESLSNSL